MIPGKIAADPSKTKLGSSQLQKCYKIKNSKKLTSQLEVDLINKNNNFTLNKIFGAYVHFINDVVDNYPVDWCKKSRYKSGDGKATSVLNKVLGKFDPKNYYDVNRKKHIEDNFYLLSIVKILMEGVQIKKAKTSPPGANSHLTVMPSLGSYANRQTAKSTADIANKLNLLYKFSLIYGKYW